jgi:dynein light intermediate chain 2
MGMIGAQGIYPLLDTRSKLVETSSPQPVPSPHREIRLENVSFTYDGIDTVLKDVNLTIAFGERVAIVGPTGGGKSTLVNAFLQKDEVPKPSTPLEFRYARKTGATGQNIVANLWELAGAAELTSLLKVVLRPERLSSSAVAITLDLSEPENALATLLQWLGDLRRHVDAMVAELKQQGDKGAAVLASVRKARDQLWAEHPDAAIEAIEAVRPIGIPVVVLVNKWDAFEAAYVEGEYRKLVCRSLRFFAHQAGASLLCTRHKDKPSTAIVRNLLSHIAFGTAAIKTVQLDHSKALVVPASADTFAGIGKPPTVEGVFADSAADKFKAAWEATFPPKETKREAQDLTMVEAEQFAEETIDELRKQKRSELMRQRKEAEFEAKMTDAYQAAESLYSAH